MGGNPCRNAAQYVTHGTQKAAHCYRKQMQASTDCPAVNAGQPSLLDHHCHGILALICVHWLPNMLLELYSSGAHLHITISCNKLYKLCIDRLQVQAMRGRSRSPFGIHLFLLEALLLPRKQLAIARTPDCTSSPRFGRLGRGAYREAALLGIWQKLCKTQHVLLSMAGLGCRLPQSCLLHVMPCTKVHICASGVQHSCNAASIISDEVMYSHTD